MALDYLHARTILREQSGCRKPRHSRSDNDDLRAILAYFGTVSTYRHVDYDDCAETGITVRFLPRKAASLGNVAKKGKAFLCCPHVIKG